LEPELQTEQQLVEQAQQQQQHCLAEKQQLVELPLEQQELKL
jgi:hypothetical protein